MQPMPQDFACNSDRDNREPTPHHEHCACKECFGRWIGTLGSYEIVHRQGRVEIRKATLIETSFPYFLAHLSAAREAAYKWTLARLAEVGVTMDPVTNRVVTAELGEDNEHN